MGRLPALSRRGARALVLLAPVLCLLAAIWLVPLPARLAVPGSPILQWRDGSVAHVGLAPDDRWRVPVGHGEVDPDYVRALIALEDGRFWWHPGVDPLAVARAVAQNLRRGAVVSGASTLTLQLVRVVEPRPRTLPSKLVEALRALQLEARLSKDEVLSLYLSFAPYGGNLEGVEAASWAWFGHGAAVLDAAEICTLLAVPQAPERRAPGRGRPEALQAARDDICRRLLAAGALPQGDAAAPLGAAEVLRAVQATPVPTAVRPLPRAVRHAAVGLLAAPPAAEGWRGPAPVATTLDRGTQRVAERVLGNHAAWLRGQGIHNASVVVIDPPSGEVRALVGNLDFWDARHGGQIAAFRVPRSPGSTLKPFLYARALDDGLILPETLLEDVPERYGSYRPQNFDGSWSGTSTAEAALSRSLNLPFVALLRTVGVEPFLGLLRDLGARSPDPRPGHYGLSLVAGGIELSPLEVAGMYATLARGGAWIEPRLRPVDAPAPPLRVFSEGAAWLTRRALSLRDRPDFPQRGRLGGAPRGIHWKTGTSFGLRDAWAVGSTATHTVAVWVGNLDNRGAPGLVGATAAAPALFDLLEALEQPGSDAWPRPGAELAPIEVCPLAGLPPGPACPARTEVLALRARVPARTCTLHARIEVDLDRGTELRPDCRAGRRSEERVVVRWPPRVLAALRGGPAGAEAPPPLDPACLATAAGAPPRIQSPPPNLVAVLVPGMDPADQEIPFEGSGSPAGGWLDWFVDGAWIGRSRPGEALWWAPSPGEHELVLMDAEGRSDRRRLRVRLGA